MIIEKPAFEKNSWDTIVRRDNWQKVALDFLCTEKTHKLKSESLWIWTLNEIAQKQIKVDHKKKFS